MLYFFNPHFARNAVHCARGLATGPLGCPTGFGASSLMNSASSRDSALDSVRVVVVSVVSVR